LKRSARVRVRVVGGRRTVATGRARTLRIFGQPTSRPEIDQVKPGDVVRLPSRDKRTLVLDGVRFFERGQFLAAPPRGKTPDGFLLEVVGSQVKDGRTHVRVKPGSLYEALPSGKIAVDLGDLASAKPQNRAARRFSRAMAAADPEAKVPFSERISCSGPESMTLNGSLDADLSPHFDLEWKTIFGLPTGIERAGATVDASLSARAQAQVSGKASCEMAPITLFKPSWTVLVTLGPVPVPVTVEIPIELSASATVEDVGVDHRLRPARRVGRARIQRR
jgi:hypothetical protein